MNAKTNILRNINMSSISHFSMRTANPIAHSNFIHSMCAVGKIKLELWGLKKSSKLKLPETSSFKTFESQKNLVWNKIYFILLICEHERF